jgi:hypothetical protein
MPLPNFYHQMPYPTDNHFGKEVHAFRYFLFKQKAIYPILGAVGLAVLAGVSSSIKNMFGNPNVTVSRSRAGNWNHAQLNSMDLAQAHRPKPVSPLPPADDSL